MERTKWELAAILSLGWVLMAANAQRCSEATSCESCYNISSLCHFCPDGKCHTISSPYGCLSGVACEEDKKCFREEPEYIGYPGAPTVLIITVSVLAFTMVTCATSVYAVALALLKGRRHTSTVEMIEIEEGRPGDDSPKEPLLPRRQMVVKTPQTFDCSCCVRLAYGITLMFICALCATVILLTPHYPSISVCSDNLRWGSIIRGLERMKIQADYQVAVSVYNPNRMHVQVHSGTGTLDYDGKKFSRVSIQPFQLPPGSVMDVMATITITPNSAWDVVQLGLDYETGSLSFLMDLTLKADISLLNEIVRQDINEFVLC